MNRIQTKIGLNERAMAIKQSSNKFIVETMNYIPSVPFSSIEIKDIKPCDVIINESGNILNVDAIEINENDYKVTFTDKNGCELVETFVPNKIVGFVDITEGEEYNEYGDLIEIYEEANKKVKLNKIMKGDVKKYKVYVKNDKGNVVKVNFGDPNMEIKRDDPARRKNFRARHNCDNPGPRWKARYWACKTWSSKSVSSMLKENVSKGGKCKDFIENIAHDTLKNLNDIKYNSDLYGLIKYRTK
jgi:hypothetical protein